MTTEQFMSLWGTFSAHPGSPAGLGALVFFVMWLVTDSRLAPHLPVWLTSTPFRKRLLASAISIGPGLVLALSQHMAWNDAARTALFTFAWSQAIKFLSTGKAPPPAMLLVFVFVPVLSACGISKDTLQKGLNGGATALNVAKPYLGHIQDAEEAQCGTDAQCKDDVKTKWDSVAFGYDCFGCLLCTLDATAEGCAKDKPCERMQAMQKELAK